MPRTENLHVRELLPLTSPRKLKQELPASPRAIRTVLRARQVIRNMLAGRDRRMLVIVGPCSIHDPAAAMEYAGRLRGLAAELRQELFIVMRVYFEKPRTTVGWKGLIYDPAMDGSADIERGLRLARRLLLEVNDMDLPAATEMLDTILPQYTADLVAWASIGARTTESQTHRQMASGLSMPIGYKNRTDGNVQVAVEAMQAARHPHSFIGVDDDGRVSVVRTTGNPLGHLVLRGGAGRPNYDARSVRQAAMLMEAAGLPPRIMVDCSHENTGKQQALQEKVWNAVWRQRLRGNEALIGLMLESHLEEGRQPIPPDPSQLRYGVSITDECVGWAATERMLRRAAQWWRKA